MRLPILALGRGAAAAALSVALACASAPGFTPDLNAKAPVLEGFGHSDIAITTRSDKARRLFNQGVLQAYAFDETEAVRSFKAALAADPGCAMCSWGVAWQLGPNINDTGRGRTAEALQYVDWALGRMKDATARERALVESLALRYAHASKARETAPLTGARCGSGSDAQPDPLDVAYADRMRELADAYPLDPDVLTLYAEAELIATPGPVPWTRDGKPVGRVGDLVQRIERLLPANASHTGLNHYLVHATDAVGVAGRAEVAADRLGQLAPASPHLLHMPSHTYVHLGRYADAVRVNQRAVAADPALAQALQAQGFTAGKDWRGHNLHFLWYAAVMSGQADVALRAAGEMGERLGRADGSFAAYARSLRLLTLVRFERWQEVLREPGVAGDDRVAMLWAAWARGVAQARTGKVDEARASLGRVHSAAAALRQQAGGKADAGASGMADFAEAQVQAEIAAAQGDLVTALARQQAALDASAALDQREPPMLAGSARLGLGRLQARAGQWQAAEATFRAALADHPGSGWALRGLAQALAGQGRDADAAATRQQLVRAWPDAPPDLRAAGG